MKRALTFSGGKPERKKGAITAKRGNSLSSRKRR